MYRLKQLGDSLYFRTFERQVSEALVRAAVNNTSTYLCMHQGKSRLQHEVGRG